MNSNKKPQSAFWSNALPILALALIFVGTFVGVIAAKRGKQELSGEKLGAALRNMTAMSSQTQQIDAAMMSYYLANTYQSFCRYYGSASLPAMGLDTSLSLKVQNRSDGQSWYDFFAESSVAELKKALVMAEEAAAQGVSLTDEEQQEAADAAQKLADSDSLVNGISAADAERALKLQLLARKMRGIVEESMTLTDGELRAYAEKNPETYETWRYRSYSFPYSSDGTAMTQEEAKASAEALAEAVDEADFLARVAAILESTQQLSPEEATVQAEKTTRAGGGSHNTGNALSDWAYDSARKAGDTTTLDRSTRYAAYLITSLPALDDSPTAVVRHILIKDADDAQSRAEALFEQWKSGEASEDSFAALAQENSEDKNSAAKGGLLSAFGRGETLPDFEDWCFDAARQSGDVGLIHSTTGWHLIYYVGSDSPKWMSEAESAAKAEKFDELCASLYDTYNVAVYEDVLDSIPA